MGRFGFGFGHARRRGRLVAAVATTLNPADKQADIALSGGNLVATIGAVAAGYRNVRSTQAKAGKGAFEVTFTALTSAGALACGFANATAALGNYTGVDTNSAGYYGGIGGYYNDAALPGQTPTTFAVGDALMFLADTALGKWWLRKANVNYEGDPAAGTGGFTLPAGPIFALVELYNPNDSATANFGATAFTNSLPAGFAGWNSL